MNINKKIGIATKRNQHGVLVCIPEKIKINNKLYTAPFRLSHHRPFQLHQVIYSFGSELNIEILFNSQSITITEPFTWHILQELLNYGARNKNAQGQSKRSNPLKLSNGLYQQFIQANQ